MPKDFVDAVYGGAEEATIKGNVALTVTSGKFGRVFGGNNKGGDIQGSITVNVYEDGCKPLIIGELYGGGFKAPYSIYGCTQSGETWTAKESGTTYYDTETQDGRDNIMVNVIACTSIGKVFGGGMGATAKVIGNTHVDINLMKGIVNSETQGDIGKIGQVFGGGGEADVIGNTRVDIGTELANEDNGVNITKGTYTDPTEGTYLSPTVDAYIDIESAGVYGGGYSADVVGNTELNIGTKNLPLDVIIAGNIFGGGYGQSTHVTGNVTVNIGTNESGTHVGYANITGDVYGGSAQGKVNSYLNNSVETASEGKTTHVNFYGGTLTGNVYGGGLGDGTNSFTADVYGPVTVDVFGGSVNKVFGCNNVLGTPKNTVTVNINGGTVNHSVYGGGNQAAYTPVGVTDYPAVNIINGTINENVFGGGLGLTAIVTGNPHVTIGDNAEGHTVAIKKSVYGGGEQAGVTGNTYIVMNSGTIGTPKDGETVYGGATYGNIYGGGLGSDGTDMTEVNAVQNAGIIKGNTNITVNGGTVLHNIYGGGAYGSVGTYAYDASNKITGRQEGKVDGVATITILGGTIGTDGHENGMIFGSSRGDIDAPDAIHDKLAWVYDAKVVIGKTEDTTAGPQIKGSVYGSGENGHTFHDASVTIHSGMVGITDTSIDGGAAYAYRGNVYGGGCGTDKYYSGEVPSGHTANDGQGDKYNPIAGIVKGNTTVTIDGGHVVRNVYGAGAMGSVTGSTTVNISGDGSGGGYVYAAARGADDMSADCATVGSTALNISGGTIWGSAFGGGQLGTVKGNVAVTVSGGVVKNDVYGGGALANTNTDNWDATSSTEEYVDITSSLTQSYIEKTVNVGESVVGLYTYDPNTKTYTAATGTAVSGVRYYETITSVLHKVWQRLCPSILPPVCGGYALLHEEDRWHMG